MKGPWIIEMARFKRFALRKRKFIKSTFRIRRKSIKMNFKKDNFRFGIVRESMIGGWFFQHVTAVLI